METALFHDIESFINEKLANGVSYVYVAMAWFTNQSLLDSLVQCSRRGMTVKVIVLDDIINRNEMALDFNELISAGGEFFLSPLELGLMHDKFCVIDGHSTITGSYNWTYYAENRNIENIIFTDNEEIADKYIGEFERIHKSLEPVCFYEHKMLSEFGKETVLRNFDLLKSEFNIEQCKLNSDIYSLLAEDRTSPDNNHGNKQSRKNLDVHAVDRRKHPVSKYNIGIKMLVGSNENYMRTIIKAGECLPFTGKSENHTAADNQTGAKCEIYYGCSPDDSSCNNLLKELTLEGIPPKPAGKVAFLTNITLDTNGYIHLEFVCKETGKALEASDVITELVNYD